MGLGFLVPLFLAGLAAIGIPLAMHLRHRERQRPTRFPSLMFLQRIAIRTDERRRITDWPLLLLRAARRDPHGSGVRATGAQSERRQLPRATRRAPLSSHSIGR